MKQNLIQIEDEMQRKHKEVTSAWVREARAAEEAARRTLVGSEVEWQVEWVDRHSMRSTTIPRSEVLEVVMGEMSEYCSLPGWNLQVVLGYRHPTTGEVMRHPKTLYSLTRSQKVADRAWMPNSRSGLEALKWAMEESPRDYTIFVRRPLGGGLLTEAASHPGSLVLDVDEDTPLDGAKERVLSACREGGRTIVVNWMGCYASPNRRKAIGWIVNAATWERDGTDTRFILMATGSGLRELLACAELYHQSQECFPICTAEGEAAKTPKVIVINAEHKEEA